MSLPPRSSSSHSRISSSSSAYHTCRRCCGRSASHLPNSIPRFVSLYGDNDKVLDQACRREGKDGNVGRWTEDGRCGRTCSRMKGYWACRRASAFFVLFCRNHNFIARTLAFINKLPSSPHTSPSIPQ